jgi:Polyketide cyclase / dehydrase and lipid transport
MPLNSTPSDPQLSCFENTIEIQASATTVEQCITDRHKMAQWLNPMLICESVGDLWSTEVGAQSRFVINLPLFKPTLQNQVIDRAPGLVVWSFQGFFVGTDRWECEAIATGTRLTNRFSFEIPNPLIRFGFDRFAQELTQADMKAQLKRIKVLAETLERQSH